jgi:IS30 family transposase
MKKAPKLTNEERSEIQILIDKRYSHRSIAKVLGRSPNTISSEIKRNSYGFTVKTSADLKGKYVASYAKQQAYVRRWRRRYRGKKIESNNNLGSFIISKLKVHWNPSEISGFLKLHKDCSAKHCNQVDCGSGCSFGLPYVSKTVIYDWLWSAYGQRYCQYLYSKRYNKKKRRKNKTKRDMIPDRVSIAERPASVELRDEPGHYEFDSVVSSKRSRSKYALAVAQERSTRLIRAAIVTSLKPSPYARTIAALVRDLKVSSLTTDNGIENKHHKEITFRLKDEPTIYFTNPYSSWQKGSVENANKMLRRYFPKGTDFSKIKQMDLDHALTRINNKPRKILGYKSSLQVAIEKGLFKR